MFKFTRSIRRQVSDFLGGSASPIVDGRQHSTDNKIVRLVAPSEAPIYEPSAVEPSVKALLAASRRKNAYAEIPPELV
jgi:hypothetical protein